ncbi:MAG: universal stress protein [Saprospiraceae bacterium]|nr:universal stress protein [Saprospiraceae bacterium]
MKAIHRILLPTDFSKVAQAAFRFALLYAAEKKASIKILHVVIPEYEALDLPVVAAQATKERVEAARIAMDSFIKYGITQVETTHQLTDIPLVSSEIEIGGVSETIDTIARKDDCDMVIMGTREEHTTFDHMFGSISSNVMANVPCDVMIVPPDSQESKIKNIAFASDLKTTDPYNIWKAAQLLEPFHPIIHCIHVQDSKNKNEMDMTEIRDFFENRAPSLQMQFKEIDGNSVSDALNDYIDTFDIDMLVMPSPQRNLIERVFHKSMTRKMSLACTIPLLVVR